MRIDFLRHGTTGRGDRLDGRGDVPLTEAGRDEMRRQTAGRRWAAVWSSPLVRAREMAQGIADRLSRPLVVDAGWAEMDFGAWEGRARLDIAAELEAFHADPVAHPPPGGEPWRDFEVRVAAALDRVLRSADAATVDCAEPVLVVAHGGPIRMALSLACGLPYERLWCLRIAYATRVGVDIGRSADGRLWGEIVEVAQP